MVVHKMWQLVDTRPFQALTKRAFDTPRAVDRCFQQGNYTAVSVKRFSGEGFKVKVKDDYNSYDLLP